MIKEIERNKFRLISLTTDFETLDQETLGLIANHSYFDYVENDYNLYAVIMDFDDTMKSIITLDDAKLANQANLGYFRYTKSNELIFVFTKTYPNNYLNCGILDLIKNKELFSANETYFTLLEKSKLETVPEFEGILKDDFGKSFLISSKEVFSNNVPKNSGYQISNFWIFHSEPLIAYKYKNRN
jgi:uncharacterized protein YjiK